MKKEDILRKLKENQIDEDLIEEIVEEVDDGVREKSSSSSKNGGQGRVQKQVRKQVQEQKEEEEEEFKTQSQSAKRKKLIIGVTSVIVVWALLFYGFYIFFGGGLKKEPKFLSDGGGNIVTQFQQIQEQQLPKETPFNPTSLSSQSPQPEVKLNFLPQNTNLTEEASETLVGERVDLQEKKIIDAVKLQNDLLRSKIEAMEKKISAIENNIKATQCNTDEIGQYLQNWWESQNQKEKTKKEERTQAVEAPREVKPEPATRRRTAPDKGTPTTATAKQKQWKVLAMSEGRAAILDEDGEQHFVGIGSVIKNDRVVNIIPEEATVVLSSGVRLRMSE